MRKELQEIINKGILYNFEFEGPATRCKISVFNSECYSEFNEVFIMATGRSVCSWDDIPKYNKYIGKKFAFMRALRSMEMKLNGIMPMHKFMR